MSDRINELRKEVKEMNYLDSFPKRLGILFSDVTELNLVMKVSHVFNTALNGIYSASVSAQEIKVEKLSVSMRDSMERNRITIDEAKILFLELKKRIIEEYGAVAIPIMISLWKERSRHIETAFKKTDPDWEPFTVEELAKVKS